MKNELRVTNEKTGETFYTTENAFYLSGCYSKKSELNRVVRQAREKSGYLAQDGWEFDSIKSAAIKKSEFTTEQEAAAHVEMMSDWHNHPATDRQIEYLVALGIHDAPQMTLTKGQASRMIDIAKTEGIGSLGYDEGAVQVRDIVEEY